MIEFSVTISESAWMRFWTAGMRSHVRLAELSSNPAMAIASFLLMPRDRPRQ